METLGTSSLVCFNNRNIKLCRERWLAETVSIKVFTYSRGVLTFATGPHPKSPGLIEQRWLQSVHVVLPQGVLAVVEEGELVVDLRDPRVLTVILAFSYLVNLLLKLLQSWGGRTVFRKLNVENVFLFWFELFEFKDWQSFLVR